MNTQVKRIKKNTTIATAPSIDYLDKKYELHIVDKQTGEILKELQQSMPFKLCAGITLDIPVQEFFAWQSQAQAIKRLAREHKATLKTFIFEIGKSRPLTREEVSTHIEELSKAPVRRKFKYRQSGHYIDEKLKYTKECRSNPLIELETTKQKIQELKIEIAIEGIKLTETEYNLDHALTKLLHLKSQNKDPRAADYYGGNEQPLPTLYCGKVTTAPVLRFKRSELYQAYLSKNRYSGDEATLIDKALLQYAAKRYLVKYDRVKKVITGTKEEILTDRIEDIITRIKILKFFPNLTREEKAALDAGDEEVRKAKEEIIIAFHPIFRDQIDTKFVEFPDDTNHRLRIAAGGFNKVTASMRKLMEWSLREISAKRPRQEINEDNLINLLDLESQKHRKKRTRLRIEKDIEAIKDMGIIVKAERKVNSSNGYKWVFDFNINYE